MDATANTFSRFTPWTAVQLAHARAARGNAPAFVGWPFLCGRLKANNTNTTQRFLHFGTVFAQFHQSSL